MRASTRRDAAAYEEALRVVHLDLAAAQGNGQIVWQSLSKPGWSSPVPMIRKSVFAPGCRGLRAGHGDAQSREAGLAAEVAHQRNKGLNLLLGGRGWQNDGGFAQVGNAREREAGVGKGLKVGQRRVVRIAAQIKVGIAQDGALHVDGRRVLAAALLEQLEGEVERERVGERAQVHHRHGHIGLHLARGFLPGNQRDRAQERVVDAHLHAGDGADGNRVVAIGQLAARHWAAGGVDRYPAECGSRRSTARCRRPATGLPWRNPTARWSGRCAPSAEPHRAAACRAG